MTTKQLNLKDPAQRTEYWEEVAAAQLVNRKITAVRYMTQEEADNMGFISRSVVIQLDDGNLVFPVADDEGNDAGALFTMDAKHNVLPVLY
jgi:hypothetical protein